MCSPSGEEPVAQREPFQRSKNILLLQYIGYGLLCLFFLKYLFFVLLVVLSTIGALLAFITCGVYFIRIPKRSDSSIRNKFSKPTFTKSEIWDEELKSLRINQSSLTSSTNSPFSQSLNQITNFILRDFVDGWFQSISEDDPSFPNQVRIQLKLAITKLESRIYLLQASDFLVLDILPLLTDHFNNFVAAEDLVLGERRNLNRTSDIDLKIVQEYGKLHPAVSIKEPDTGCEVKRYSRSKTSELVPFLISKDEQSSVAVMVLIRELLSNTVLLPVIRLISDPDFLNQTIVKLTAATLNDRDQVKELRGAIDKQYNDPGKPVLIPTITRNPLLDNRINPNMRQPEFEKYLKTIDRSESLQLLKQLKYYIAVQISRTHKIQSNSEKFLKYRKRLHIARNVVDNRLELSGSPPIEERRRSAVFTRDLDGFITNLSLSQILSNPSSLSFFMEFMEQRSRTVLLQYWLTVNGIKDPLEDPKNPEYEEELSSSIDMDGSADMKQIFNRYFDDKALKIKEDTYNDVKSFVDGTSKSLAKYIQVRKYILILQEEVFHRMEGRDLPDFKNSELFLKLLSSEAFEESLVNEVDMAHEPSFDELHHGDEGDDEDIPVLSGGSPMPELEAALNDIMSQDNNEKVLTSSLSKSNSTTLSPKVGSAEDLKHDLFGAPSKGFLREKPLFEDSDDDELEETESIFSDSKFEDDPDFFSASHNVLNLKEEISKIDQEIEKLNKQNQMLDPMVLRAELINSTNELKILKKSRASYEREIEAKELQKQQLIVQDNESSLYGKTKVSIESWVKGRSRGKDYILYVVEVQRSTEGKSGTGWIIGRRFSQFHRLHELLKRKYEQVYSLPFPKKKVILKFQQKALIDERRLQLEYYLKKLLEIEEVCSDQEFRKFLTNQDYKIAASSEVSTPRSRLEDTASKIYNGLSTSIDMLNSRASSTDNLSNVRDPSEESSNYSQTVGKVEDMQKELETYDLPTSGRSDSQKSFIKPVTNLVIALFSLNRPNSWLRGRAIIVVLQQIFGSTIEKHIKDLITGQTTEDKIMDIIVMLTDNLWPNGKFMESGIPRTSKEKSKSKQEAKILLETLLIDTCSKIVGQPSAKSASSKIFAMVQNEVLNRSLVYQILDKVLESIFPEINEGN